MSYAITLVAFVAAGLALLAVLRLRTGSRPTDVALAWLVGSGWFAAVAPVVRFGLGVPLGRVTAAAIVLAPVAGWGVLRLRRRFEATLPRPAERGEGSGEGKGPGEGKTRERGRARGSPARSGRTCRSSIYVAVVTAAVILHGTNMPTQTDDGVRVRALAPMLAFADEWSPAARGIFSMAGPLPTFVPALAWIATGTLDHFHVNYAVLTELVALLVLAVGLGSSRGSPERGWAGAFGLLSIPLFVYHCTSTYSDAVLAMRLGGGLLFALEYGRAARPGRGAGEAGPAPSGQARADLSRALLLLGLAALVKREGELVAAAPAAVLLAQIAWARWRGGRELPWAAVALLAAPVVLGAAGKIAGVGLAAAFPMLGFVVAQAGAAAAPAAGRAGLSRAAAGLFFDRALFRAGNQGMIYWVLVATIVARARSLARSGLAWPLLAVGALFAEVAVSSIWLIPEFTLDEGTVNRALLVVSVPAALWLAAALTDAVRVEPAQGAMDEDARAIRRAPLAPAKRGRG